MKQQYKFKTIATAAITTFVILVMLNSTQAMAQQQMIPVQKQSTASTIPPPGTPLPKPIPINPNDPQVRYAQAIINELNHRLGNNTNAASAAAILAQMTAEGKISCPTFTNLKHCLLLPPAEAARQAQLLPPSDLAK
jgi:hypothetical protein